MEQIEKGMAKEEKEEDKPFQFFRLALGNPKYIVAPMVDQSELGFRMLCRKYNAQLCYTPMFHSANFAKYRQYRKKFFVSCPEDRPLIVQFCGNDPSEVLKAAKYVEDHCDAVDLNLGCPQRIAKKGNYGAFLMDDPNTVEAIVRNLSKNLKVPVFCKIRIFEELDRTIAFAKMLEAAGCSLLTVHGRTKEMKGKKAGLANFEYIKAIKLALKIPVISNGNIITIQDVEKALTETGADGVMSAEGILKNPALFSGLNLSPFELAEECIEFGINYKSPILWVKNHVAWILLDYVYDYSICRDKVLACWDFEALKESVREFKEAVREGKKSAPIPTREKYIKNIEETFDSNLFVDDVNFDENL